MAYLKCTEELGPLGFQTQTFEMLRLCGEGHSGPLIPRHSIYMCFQSHLIQSSWQKCCIKQMCSVCVCVWFGGFLLRDVDHALFCAMCTYSLNDILFFNFAEQVVDKSIYCCVGKYCAVFWSVTSVSVYFSCSCECAWVFASSCWGIFVI